MKEKQKDLSIDKKHETYTMEQLRTMSVKQLLSLNGLGTLKKNPPKAIQITGQGLTKTPTKGNK